MPQERGPFMTDDLERLVRSTEGEGPSPEFVTRLRERIVAETSPPGIPADDHPVVDIDLRSNRSDRRDTATATRWNWWHWWRRSWR